MMSELIRVSLFCDTDFPTVDTNLLDLLTDERPLSSCSFLQPGPGSCQDTTAAILDSIVHFSNTVAEAKVDLSTFNTNTVSPDSIFGNDYLQAVADVKHDDPPSVEPAYFKGADEQPTQSTTATKPRAPPAEQQAQSTIPSCTAKPRDFNLPPYSYRSLSIAAIFLSKREHVTRFDVIDDVTEMFEVHRVVREKCGRKWTKNICHVSNAMRKTIINESGQLRLNFANIDMNIFYPRQHRVGDTEYTENLFARLGCPGKYEELHDLVKEARKSSKEYENEGETARDYVARMRAESARTTTVREQLSAKRARSDSVSISRAEVTKRACLRLPARPCLSDDNSNDSLQPSMAEVRVDDGAHACAASPAALPAFNATFLPQVQQYSPMNVLYAVPYYATRQPL